MLMRRCLRWNRNYNVQIRGIVVQKDSISSPRTWFSEAVMFSILCGTLTIDQRQHGLCGGCERRRVFKKGPYPTRKQMLILLLEARTPPGTAVILVECFSSSCLHQPLLYSTGKTLQWWDSAESHFAAAKWLLRRPMNAAWRSNDRSWVLPLTDEDAAQKNSRWEHSFDSFSGLRGNNFTARCSNTI